MSGFIGLSKEQIEVIEENTRDAISSGLAGRHGRALLALAEEEREQSQAEDISSTRQDTRLLFADWIEEAYSSEFPFTFRLDQETGHRRVVMEKITRRTGMWYPMSGAEVGLIDGEYGDGQPLEPFTHDDLSFAMQALEKQKNVGFRRGTALQP